jgi:hypothetical protein
MRKWLLVPCDGPCASRKLIDKLFLLLRDLIQFHHDVQLLVLLLFRSVSVIKNKGLLKYISENDSRQHDHTIKGGW